MNRVLLIYLYLCIGIGAATAQNLRNLTVEGVLTDSLDQPLVSATVVLLQAADSVIASFGITNAKGQFNLQRIIMGEYLLQATYIGYKSYSEYMKLSGDPLETNVGVIRMDPETTLLNEALITADRIPMQIRKDTIVYNADAFKTKPNAIVEDLLKQLPGIEVEEDGNIKAQGEDVRRVLVDGKEFFGNDPKIATKNLPADVVSHVEVFDKQSEMAEFSGIDDGIREKTINLELKEDRKQGVFGRLSGGLGNNERWEGKASVNRFDKNQQISFLGILNNTNQQGFSINDYISFAGGMQNVMGRGGGRSGISINANETGVPINQGISDGLVQTGATGLNFNRDFGEKTELNLSYFFNDINNRIEQHVRRENYLSENSFLSEEYDERETDNLNHRFNMSLLYKLDTTQNLKLNANFSLNNSEYFNTGLSSVLDGESVIQNEGWRDNESTGDRNSADGELIYRKRFKKGRVFTTSLNVGWSRNDQGALLQSVSLFPDEGGQIIRADSLLQNQQEAADQTDYGIRLSYTEPLGKGKYVELNFTRRNYSNELLKDVYDLENGYPGIFNSSLSNHYNRDYTYDNGGISFRWNKGTSNLNLSVNLQQSDLDGQILSNETAIQKKYTNLLPRIRWNYDFSNSTHFTADYGTSVREPSLEQLQPIVDNSNPLNIYIGNPDLRPEYRHNLRLRFMSFSQFTMTGLFASIGATYTDNSITNARLVDEYFRQLTTPVNIDHDWRLSSFAGFSTPLKLIRTRINVHTNFSYSNGIIFVNNQENETNRYNTSIDISFNNIKKDILDIRMGGRLGHNLTKYSEDKNLDQDYFNHRYYTDLTITLLKSWAINSSFTYSIYSGGTLAENRNVPIWHAGISKYLMNNRGELKLAAFDLLNENIGIHQNVDLNYIEDIRINSLGQYFMLSFTYNLNKFGSEERGRGGIHVIERRG